jgi:hypothetical protein
MTTGGERTIGPASGKGVSVNANLAPRQLGWRQLHAAPWFAKSPRLFEKKSHRENFSLASRTKRFHLANQSREKSRLTRSRPQSCAQPAERMPQHMRVSLVRVGDVVV